MKMGRWVASSWKQGHLRVPISFELHIGLTDNTADIYFRRMAAPAYIVRTKGEKGAFMKGIQEGFRRLLTKYHFFAVCQAVTPVSRYPDPWQYYEVFVRLKDEEQWRLPPGAFVPALERFGFLSDLDHWVVRDVIGWYGEQQFKGISPHVFGINLSWHTMTVTRHSFLDFVQEQCDSNGVSLHSLCFEIDESLVDTYAAEIASFINKATAVGCRIAIDDYVDGKRPADFLRRMPVDFVKISGRITRNMQENTDNFRQAEKIQRACSRFGIRTVAGLVESPECLAKVREAEIDYAQGALVGKARMLDSLDHCISERQSFGSVIPLDGKVEVPMHAAVL